MFSNKFICANKNFSTATEFVNAPYIRKTFSVESFNSAKIYVCGLGFYRVFINGEEITKGLLCPYISNSNDMVYYDEYDLTNYLKEGNNCIGFILGNGMQNSVGGNNWDFDKADFRSSPKLSVSLMVDGKVFIEADQSFKWCKSPILFDDLRLGEHYDARLEVDGWNKVDFDDSKWQNCTFTDEPKGEKRLSQIAPIVKYKEIMPVSIKKSGKGYIYDFGYNSAGLCTLKICGDIGQKITLTYGEVIDGGKLDLKNLYNPKTIKELAHIDIYICKGEGVEVYQPSFTYHGFQYVYVEGITEEQASKDLLTFNLYSSKIAKKTAFNCSNETLNKIYQMCENASLSNFYHFPTDCPQREKNGWTGDVAVSVEQMLLNFDCANNLREWLNNVRKAQREDGALPGIVPTTGWGFAWGNGPAWDQVIGLVPYYIYKYTGNKEVLEENSDALFKYIKYMKTKKGIYGIAYGLGDWCEVMAQNPTTPLVITDSLICYNLCKKAEFIFNLLGKKEELEFTQNFSKEIYNDFRKIYVTSKGLCISETQTGYALLIAYGMLTEEETRNALDRLIELIHWNRDKMRVGILGARELFHVLSRYGYHDLAYKMVVDIEYPSYGELVEKGFTSLVENFYQTEIVDGELKTFTRQQFHSLNHHMFSDISHWIIENVLGAKVNPKVENAKHIVIKCCHISDISFAEGTYEFGEDKLFISWQRKENNTIEMSVKVFGVLEIEFDTKGFSLEKIIEKDNEKRLELKVI